MIQDDKINNLVEKISNIQDYTNATCQELRKLNNIINSISAEANHAMRNNPYIVRCVIKHIANGLAVQDSIIATANELGEPIQRVNVLFEHTKIYHTALRLYSRRYMCAKLKETGYKTAQIAKIMGISTNHVYKLLKTDVNLWVLGRF